jgi:ABC-type antimicrobial peptide transport system permease subunit
MGLTIGLVSALLLSRLLASVLYEVTGTDPLTYITAAVVLLAIATVASIMPAWKAAAADPVESLRTE